MGVASTDTSLNEDLFNNHVNKSFCVPGVSLAQNPYELWLNASGARRLRLMRAPLGVLPYLQSLPM